MNKLACFIATVKKFDKCGRPLVGLVLGEESADFLDAKKRVDDCIFRGLLSKKLTKRDFEVALYCTMFWLTRLAQEILQKYGIQMYREFFIVD